MKFGKKWILMIPIIILIPLVFSSFFVVSQVEQSIVLQFGEMVRVVREPGLQIKLPFIQDVIFYDKRMLDLDISDIEVTLGDQKRIVVNTFTRYKISDPEKFYKTVRNEMGVHSRLSAVITGTLRSVLGHATLGKLLSSERTPVMYQIREKVDKATQGLGIHVVEVRIKRADLPQENSKAIFQRMISERRAEAAQIRSRGEEIAAIIRADTDKQCVLIEAEAQKQAQILFGQAESEEGRLYREAYGKSPKFAFLYRLLEAYKASFSDSMTTYVLSSDSDFLKLFRKDIPKDLMP